MHKTNINESDDSQDEQTDKYPLKAPLKKKQSYCRIPQRLLIISICIILLIIFLKPNSTIDNEQTILSLVMLDDPSALCLDGSQGAYYIQQGNPQKLLIFFNGGGWCRGLNYQQTIQQCYNRSFTIAGSSSFYKKIIKPYNGMFRNSSQNYFRDWTKVLLSYCDGSGHQGTRLQPITYKDRKLYFRGYNITIAQIKSLNNSHQIFSSKIKQITITGISAGAVAAYQWINYLKTHIHSQTKIHFIADSPIFLNYPVYNDTIYALQAAYQNIINITNQQIGTPLQQCNTAYPNQLWKCMFFEYFHPFATTPVFLLQSLYDTWCLQQILKIRCQYKQNIFNSCSSQQMAAIESYSTGTRNLIKMIQHDSGNGIWTIACMIHTFTYTYVYDSSNWKIPQQNGKTAAIAIQNWMQKKGTNHIHIDDIKWPYNHPCSNARPWNF